MTAARGQAAQHRTYRFGRQVALPVLTLLAAAMLAVVAFVGYSAARQTQDAQEQSTRAMRGAIGMKVQEIARTAQDYAWWNGRSAILISTLTTWADSNVGRYIYETFDYDITWVIGRDDRIRYATIAGERRPAVAAELAPGLGHLVAKARLIPRDQPGAVSGYVLIDGVVAMVGASPITPEPGNAIDAPQGHAPSWSMARFSTATCSIRSAGASGSPICGPSRPRRRPRPCCRSAPRTARTSVGSPGSRRPWAEVHR